MKPLRLFLALGLLVFVSSVLGQAPALVRQSPFAGGAVVVSGAGAPALELRGIVSGPEGSRFWICDPASKSGAWAAVSESGFPFLVQIGDPDAETATVEEGGRVFLLHLKNARVLPVSVASAEDTPKESAAGTFSYVMTRRLPGEPRAPRPSAAP